MRNSSNNSDSVGRYLVVIGKYKFFKIPKCSTRMHYYVYEQEIAKGLLNEWMMIAFIVDIYNLNFVVCWID